MFIARRWSAVGLSRYDSRSHLERLGDLDLGLAENDAGLFFARRLRLARHRVLERHRDDHVAHFHRLDRHAPRIRPLIDEQLQLVLDPLAAPQEIDERRAADDVAQRRLRGPADGPAVVLHFERRLLRVVHHPEQHGVDVDGHRVGGERLLRGETRRDGALIDPRRQRRRRTARPRTGPGRASRGSGPAAARSRAPTACAILGDCIAIRPITTDTMTGTGLPVAIVASRPTTIEPRSTRIETTLTFGTAVSFFDRLSRPALPRLALLLQRRGDIVGGEPVGVGVGQHARDEGAQPARVFVRRPDRLGAPMRTNDPTPRRVSSTPARSSPA